MMSDGTRCSVVRDLLPGYIDGVTGEKTNAFVAAHLAECTECRAAHRAMTGRLTGDEVKTEAMLKHMRRRGKLRRVRAWSIALALLLAVAICLLPLPRHVSCTYRAIEWRSGDRGSAAPRTIGVEGFYMDYLFRTDRFEGDIRVEGYPITEQQTAPAVFDYGGKGALLSYYIQDEESLESLCAYGYDQAGALYHFGMLLMDPDGGALTILRYEDGGWSGDGGAVISGPANSREEAAAAAQRLALKYSPAFLGRSRWEDSLPQGD